MDRVEDDRDLEIVPGDNLEEEDNRTEYEREYDRQIDRLDTFFASLQPGVTLLVERLKPTWCSGLLEEMTVSEEAINLGYFIENWGGQLLLVKVRGPRGRLSGSYKIPLHTYPPLRFGEKIYRRQLENPDKIKDDPQASQLPVIVNPPSPNGSSKAIEKIIAAIPTILPFVLKWIEASESRRQADMALILNQQHIANASPYNSLTEAFGLFTQLQSRFQNTDKSDNDEIIGLLGKMADAFGSNKTPPDTRISPPSVRSSQNQPIHEILSKMPPTQALATFQSAVSAMPPEGQAQTLSELIGSLDQLGGRDLLLQELERRGILEPEDEIPETDDPPDTGG